WHFYEFSREHPQYFALMFVDRSVPRVSREYERFAFAREKKASIIAEIAECIAAGELPASLDPAAAMRSLTAGLIGVAVLSLSDRVAPDEDADRIAANVLDTTLAGLKSGVALQPITTSECPLEEVPVERASFVESRSRR